MYAFKERPLPSELNNENTHFSSGSHVYMISERKKERKKDRPI